jgi:hypothetical protein
LNATRASARHQGRQTSQTGGRHGQGGLPSWPCSWRNSHAHADGPAWAWRPKS